MSSLIPLSILVGYIHEIEVTDFSCTSGRIFVASIKKNG